MIRSYILVSTICFITGSCSIVGFWSKKDETHKSLDMTNADILNSSARVSVPCSKEDFTCWCNKAVEYTNDVRKKAGVTAMLKVGTESQLANANKHALNLAKRGTLNHQDLTQATRDVGCQRWVGGENVARNSEPDGDIAKTCVEQWENSPPHLKAMTAEVFEEAVVGVAFANGMVYCVETFAMQQQAGTFGSPSDNGCKMVGSSQASTSDSSTGNSVVGTEEEEDDTSRDMDVGMNSCRCLAKGMTCRQGLASMTNNQCSAKTLARDQGSGCKKQCCDYCAIRGRSKRCAQPNIRAICG